MKRLLLFTVPLFLASCASFAAGFPKALKDVEAHYAKAKTLKMDFEQVTRSASLGTERKTKGEILWMRPDFLRWDTKSPDPSLLVSDGKVFWFYTPPFSPGDPGQAVKTSANRVASKIAVELLRGSFRSVRSLPVKTVSKDTYSFEPKKGTAGDVLRIELRVDPAASTIMGVRLEHVSGNSTDLALSGVKPGAPLDAKLFRFDPPKGTQITVEP